MDSQAQDRAHRIGQTREVHIFRCAVERRGTVRCCGNDSARRLISEHTVEENILLKARQRRALNQLSLEVGGGVYVSACLCVCMWCVCVCVCVCVCE